MGILRHGDRTLGLDDVLLAHLQVVLAGRFRQGDEVELTWREAASPSGAERVAWRLSPAVPTYFVFGSPPPTGFDGHWLRRLDAEQGVIALTGAEGRPVVLAAPPTAPVRRDDLIARLRRTLAGRGRVGGRP